MADPPPPSDHLLRTMAAVPVSSQVLDLGCGEGRHTHPLLRLGFPVHACDPRPEAVEAARAHVRELVGEEKAETCVQVASLEALEHLDATFDWIVADRADAYVSSVEDLSLFFEKVHRLLKPGGWIYVTVPAASTEEEVTDQPSPPENQADPGRFTVATVEAERETAGLAEASEATVVEEEGRSVVRAIYRRVEPETPA